MLGLARGTKIRIKVLDYFSKSKWDCSYCSMRQVRMGFRRMKEDKKSRLLHQASHICLCFSWLLLLPTALIWEAEANLGNLMIPKYGTADAHCNHRGQTHPGLSKTFILHLRTSLLEVAVPAQL